MILPRAPQTAGDVAGHYDELDPLYRRFWGEHLHHGLWEDPGLTPAEAVAALSDRVGRALGLAPGMALVDIGCGYGGTARRFAAAGATVTGVTLSAAQAAAAPPAPGVVIHVRDWLRSRLPSRAFDGAYAIESSEHMSDKPGFFAEAARVLKPGAPLVICAWLSAPAPSRLEVRHLLEPICSEGRLPSLLTADEYLGLAAAAGFGAAPPEDLSRAVARTWDICLQRFLGAFLREPALWRMALAARERRFAWSLPRLALAYRTGALRYGLFRFRAP